MGPTCPANGGEVSCDEPGDCPGQICCGTFVANGYSQVQCQNTCQGGGSIIVCDTTAGDCTGNDTCNQSGFLPASYLICN
jgi:hypothetical protein